MSDSVSTKILSPEDSFHFFRKLGSQTQECLEVLALDNSNQALRKARLFKGTATEILVSPREILRFVLLVDAVKFIVAHNHPSQSILPSRWDRQFTRLLQRAAQLVGLKFLDHLIVSRTEFYSFAEASDWREAQTLDVRWQDPLKLNDRCPCSRST